MNWTYYCPYAVASSMACTWLRLGFRKLEIENEAFHNKIIKPIKRQFNSSINSSNEISGIFICLLFYNYCKTLQNHKN